MWQKIQLGDRTLEICAHLLWIQVYQVSNKGKLRDICMFFGKKHPKPKTIQSFKIVEFSTVFKDCMVFSFGCFFQKNILINCNFPLFDTWYNLNSKQVRTNF